MKMQVKDIILKKLKLYTFQIVLLFFASYSLAQDQGLNQDQKNKEESGLWDSTKKVMDDILPEKLSDKINPDEQSKEPPGLELKITVEGLNEAETKNTLVYLDIEKNRSSPRLNELWLKQLHSKAKENIVQSLHAFGYYQIKIESQLSKNAEGVWQASYVIQKGEKVKFSNIDLQISGAGAEEDDIIAAQKNFSIKKGDLLDHELYEKSKTNLLSLIGNLGYADAKIDKKQLLVDPEINTVELVLHLSTGEKYYLGEFRFHQDVLKPKLLNKYLVDVKPGDYYSQKNLLEIQQSLVQSGFFSLVDVDPDVEQAKEQRVPVDITLSPAKQHKFSFGVGYDTEIELNASARWQNRLINSSGHSSDVLLKVSPKQSKLKGNYWIPINDPRTDKLGFMTKFEHENTDYTYRDTLDLEASYVFKWRDWDMKLFSEYKHEQYNIGQLSLTSSLLSIGGRVDGLFIEKKPYPRKGWVLFSELRGSPGKTVSDTAYTRLHIKSKVILPVMDEGRFILRGELGAADVDDNIKYPSSLRFYAGGDQSVRGYNWKSLGPTDLQGNVVGGRNVVTASIEYNHKINKSWLGAVFFDVGNSFNDKYDKLYTGAGVGARWISPVGLVRLDAGFPLNDDDKIPDTDPVVLYFGFEVSL